MTLRQLLAEKREAIAQSWLKSALAAYADNAAALFAREKDPFANPVGHALRGGTARILDILLVDTDADVEGIREQLLDMMKIRAVQPLAPSLAVGFVLRLREIIRSELGGAAADPRFASELSELDAQIDRIALAAFDAFVECREQVYELRMGEVKRQVSWIVNKVNQQDPEPELVQIESRREGLR